MTTTKSMIKRVTPAEIIFEFEGKTGQVDGEALMPGSSPDFVIYSYSFKKWERPHARELLDDEMRQRVLEAVVVAMLSERKITAEIE